MTVILRIDVDNPYRSTSIFDITLNRLRIDLEDIFPALPRLGYLSYLDSLLHDLTSRGITANFFFMRSTVPNMEISERLVEGNHGVGFHAHRTDFKDFTRDLEVVRKHLPGCVIQGFSKHGSGVRKLGFRHSPGYNEEDLVSLAKRSGLGYFSGNDENPSTHSKKTGNVLLFPSAFWLDPKRRTSANNLDWLLTESRQREIVCLLHPKEYALDGDTRTFFERLVGAVDNFSTFDELLSRS